MYRPFPTVRVVPSAEFTYLSSSGLDLLEFQDFTISHQSNRMGFRLAGSPIELDRKIELVSSAVCFGTIQLLPDGQLIVLMADHQTTGGYPRLAQVIARDLPLLAQLGANDKVAFYFVDVGHAEELAVEFERELTMLRIGAKMLT
jgi:antagonist of KipI